MQTLDRRNTHPLINAETGQYNDPSDVDLRNTNAQVRGSSGSTVRDVSVSLLFPCPGVTVVGRMLSLLLNIRSGIHSSLSLFQQLGKVEVESKVLCK